MPLGLSRSMKTALSVLTFVVMSTHAATAAEPTTLTRFEVDEPVRHAIYTELAGAGVTAAFSINYDHFFEDNFSLRLGYGVSAYFFAPIMGAVGASHGAIVTANYFVGDGPTRFEVGAGLSVVEATSGTPFDLEVADNIYVVPNAFVGVRYTPRDGGMLVRAGLTLSHAWGAPFSFGLGGAF